MIKRIIFLITILFLSLNHSLAQQKYNAESRPWTYWWWMGSSVTRQEITRNLEDIHTAGLGGVHIIPIYGEKGDENDFVKYLSPEWMELLKYTVSEARNLGMGVDMTSGTGWPFGGPDVTSEDAAKVLDVAEIKLSDHTNLKDYPKRDSNEDLMLLAAYDEQGNYTDITSKADSVGLIHLSSGQKPVKVYAAFQSLTNQEVKRAAPGGEGLVLDHFSGRSILNYMKTFEDSFNRAGLANGNIRSFYCDSYEVYSANWTNDYLSEFRKRRGYDLPPYIRYLADTGNSDIRNRVVTDYCETISDLLYDRFAKNWIKKCHSMGIITRYQAHGSPGNLLDLYSLSDIPETESFGASGFSIPGLRLDPDYDEQRFSRPDPLIMKFASSAGNIAGRKLVSSETTTWLADHFKVSLSQIKPQIDEVFVAGINHVFFHGTTFSPVEKPFPGRLFYASTNYGPSSHFWNELPDLCRYIARCQSVLQNSINDNDILLYFPVHEAWFNQKSEQIILSFDVHSPGWLQNSSFGSLARLLWDNGYTFDYISDRQIEGLEVLNKMLVAGKSRYKVILVPDIKHMPLETLKQLNDLARRGAAVIFEKDIPADVPGFFDFKNKTSSMALIRKELLLSSNVRVTSGIFNALSEKKIYPEEMASKGLEFIRKKSGDSTIYFISNLSDRFYENWIRLSAKTQVADIYDPLNDRHGMAAVHKWKTGTSVYLQLNPGQSCILTCGGMPNSSKWEYVKTEDRNKVEISGEWHLTPVKGPPEIPEPASLNVPQSWTSLGGKYETFSGKAIYSNSFNVPDELLDADGFILDMGIIRETARVKINGQELGLAWCLPNRLKIPGGIIRKTNTIEIEVTNLSFNRIIQMDRQGIQWKNFQEINFVNIRYEPYDAADKKPEDSGLMSEIYLIPFSLFKPEI